MTRVSNRASAQDPDGLSGPAGTVLRPRLVDPAFVAFGSRFGFVFLVDTSAANCVTTSPAGAAIGAASIEAAPWPEAARGTRATAARPRARESLACAARIFPGTS